SAAAHDNLPASGATGYVKALQLDLLELGFAISGPANGTFGRETSWAVRELQASAKLDTLAKERPGASGPYPERLSPAPNGLKYTGPVSGVLNAETRALIDRWLAERWRCPVVVVARKLTGSTPTGVYSGKDNVWAADQVTATTPRMYVRDYSGYYTRPATHASETEVVLGRYVAYAGFGGPYSQAPQHTWAEAELTPEHLVGTALGSLSASQRSTYKAIRAVSEVECMGFFDSINAYDNAFVSLGPCHWTLGVIPKNKPLEKGELCGYLAYVAYADPDAFKRAFEFFGARIDADWLDAAGHPTGQRLFSKDQRKYTGWISLQQDDGTYKAADLVASEGDWFKTWHWVYRFAMAGRTIDGFRRRMWHMARMRLRDLLSTPWDAASNVPDVPDGGGTRTATIGDVFSSERATAMLLRWHVFRPAHVIAGGKAGPHLQSALKRAKIPAAAGDPSTWTDAHQRALVKALTDEVAAVGNADLVDTIGQVHDFPRWAPPHTNPRGYALDPAVGALDEAARSFSLDSTDLPPAPAYA
ncbi:MAG TPA: peptidoglycan-binding domain-containing protein, partial [Solirubrobacter sp.]